MCDLREHKENEKQMLGKMKSVMLATEHSDHSLNITVY
jgi:hypothetical protein